MARYRRQYHGAVYLISKGSLSTIINLNFNFGDILFCVSMVAWAFYTILVAQVSKYVSAYSAVAWAGLLGLADYGCLQYPDRAVCTAL